MIFQIMANKEEQNHILNMLQQIENLDDELEELRQRKEQVDLELTKEKIQLGRVKTKKENSFWL